MGRKEEFKESIIEVVQYLTHYELSQTGQKLLFQYFNDSRANTAYEKALDAIERYYPDAMSREDKLTPKLEALLKNMQSQAKAWDLG